jgi:hypothetical protein
MYVMRTDTLLKKKSGAMATDLGENYCAVPVLVRKIASALNRRMAMRSAMTALLVLLAILITTRTADAWNSVPDSPRWYSNTGSTGPGSRAGCVM